MNGINRFLATRKISMASPTVRYSTWPSYGVISQNSGNDERCTWHPTWQRRRTRQWGSLIYLPISLHSERQRTTTIHLSISIRYTAMIFTFWTFETTVSSHRSHPTKNPSISGTNFMKSIKLFWIEWMVLHTKNCDSMEVFPERAAQTTERTDTRINATYDSNERAISAYINIKQNT